METTKQSKLDEVFLGTSFEDYQYEDFDNADDLIEDFEEQIRQDEVIYYSKAIEYLSENDASLHESLALADEMGYQTSDLNSELLATLLSQQELMNELSDLREDIEEAFEED